MDEGKYGPLLNEAGVKVHCLDMNPARPNPFIFFKLARLIRKESPNVVQTWMYHADFLGGISAKLAGVNKIFWGIHHSSLDKGKAKSSTIAVARVCAFLSFFIPNKIIFCAHKSLAIHKKMGYKSNKFFVIPNGYDLGEFKEDLVGAKAVRDEFNIKPDTFLIGMVGRYHPFKDHDNLLKAFAEIRSAGVECKCLLVGKGLSKENQELMGLVKALNLDDDMILAGQRNDIPAVMSAIDLHVLSSCSEAFPNVIAESMACGTPSVSTDVGDATEIIGDDRLLCPPQDFYALSNVIIAMHCEWFRTPEKWTLRSKECVERIEKNYSIEKMAFGYERCWFGF